MRLDVRGAQAAIAREVAEPLGLSVDEAASAMIEVATENMVQAIMDITVNQGIDPREAVLVGGGGAAGLNSRADRAPAGNAAPADPRGRARRLSAAGALMSDLTAQFHATLFTTQPTASTSERVNRACWTRSSARRAPSSTGRARARASRR